MKVLFILQNAWSGLYAGGEWPRKSWLRALHSSRSGQRLSILTVEVQGMCTWNGIDKRYEFDYENTRPIVGKTSKSVVPPDKEYIVKALKRSNPDIVVLCGRQAAAAVDGLWPGKLMFDQHPAHRLLTNKLYQLAARYIVTDFTGHGYIELKQKKEGILVIHG